jgi:hypothetical protein
MVDILLNIFDLFSKTFFLFYSYEIDKSNQNIQSNTNSNRWFYYIEHYFYINTFPNNFFQMFLRDILILLSHNKIKFFLINSYKPWSHNRPVTPIPQRQIPVRASHVAPLRQSHRWIHPGPYQPRSQAKEKIEQNRRWIEEKELMTNIVHNIVQHDPNDINNGLLMVHIEHYSYTDIFVDNPVDHNNLRISRSKKNFLMKNNHLLDKE